MAAIVHPENQLPNAGSRIRFKGAAARQRQTEKRNRTLLHLLHWHYLNVYVLMALLEVKESAAEETLTDLIKAGLLQTIPTSASAGRVAMLTPAGYEVASQFFTAEQAEVKVPVHPSRVRVDLINHNLIVQRSALDLRLSAIHDSGWDEGEVVIAPASHIQKHRFQPGDNIPDAQVWVAGHPPHEIEVQETYSQSFPRRLSRIAERINSGEVDACCIVSTNKSLLAHYEDITKHRLKRWFYSSGQKRWYEERDSRSPYGAMTEGRIYFKLVEERRRFYRF
jgi:hypothetical protein